MAHLGNYAEDYATLNFKFTTVASDGTPTALVGGVIKVYAANETGTETSTGVTLVADFDGVTGMNNVLIDLSADAFYATGKDYQVIITTGTVDGTSVVGYVVAEFSIENRFMRGTDSAATEAKQDIMQTNIDLLEKFLKNRLDVDVSGSQMILYDDDNTTPLFTWPLTDKDGNSITVATGVPTERGIAV